ncbi:hypothetical protein ACFQ7J_08285 [Streptomyces sp. NPDC056501]|uniref:hypothetical protein n=1 Tax=Streptomyces sp. NPDC056501 TaxID=3345841 RepID=UPI0036B3A925
MSKHVLAQNQYGKAENRIVTVTRKGNDGAWHEIRDLNVSVALRGEWSGSTSRTSTTSSWTWSPSG